MLQSVVLTPLLRLVVSSTHLHECHLNIWELYAVIDNALYPGYYT